MEENLQKLLLKLISFRSRSYEELPLVNYLSDLLNEKNIPHIVDEFNPSNYLNQNRIFNPTANLYVEIGHGEETLVLYSHLDVVNAHEEFFTPKIIEDKIFGRGTSDMKTSLAGLIYVLLNDYESLKSINKRIIFAFLADEETSATGARRFVEWLKSKNLKDFFCILMEPTNDFKLIENGGRGYVFLDIRGNMRDIVNSFRNIHSKKTDILQKYPDNCDGFGPATLELTKIVVKRQEKLNESITVVGKSAHASRPHLGINAIEKALLQHKSIYYIHSSESESSNSLPSEVIISTRSEDHTDEIVTASIDLRMNLSASKNNSLLGEVMALISPSLSMNIRDHGPAFIVENKKLLELCKRDMPMNPRESIALGGSDAPYLLELTPHIIAGFGPGDISVAHTDHEFVHIGAVELTPVVVRQLIKNFIEIK